MSFRRQLVLSFGVQGAGAAAVLLATLWLGARLGPEAQGEFSRTKSEVEFLAALAMFGLPQALFFHVKSGAMSGQAALRWAMGSALLAGPIGIGYGLLQHPEAGAFAGLLGAAVMAIVMHGQLRTLLLVRERSVWFNAATAAPQVLVLAGVGLVIASASGAGANAWLVVFAIAFGAVAALAWQRLRRAPDVTPAASASWRALGRYGLAAWLTAALSTAAIVAVQRWVEQAEGRATLGRFTLAMTLVQVPLTPIAYAAPLLFRRWMEQPGGQASRRWGAGLFAALLGVALAVWLASSVWPDLGLGAAYAGTTRALAVLLVGAAAEAASRVLTVQASASGRPWVAVRAEAARWAVLALGWAVPGSHGLEALCAVWSVGAIAAAAVFVWHGCQAVESGSTLR